jgi:hypothetical protein
VRVLFDREVPHITRVGTVVLQHCLLRRRGEQPVPGHTNIVSVRADISEEVERRFLPGSRAGVSTPCY